MKMMMIIFKMIMMKIVTIIMNYKNQGHKYNPCLNSMKHAMLQLFITLQLAIAVKFLQHI